jgi:putative FmdB family regulatory protein
MPVYDYECEVCGVFTALRPMARYREPLDCPNCGREAGRAFLTAPALASMGTQRRTAHAINERAAHEPRSSGALNHGAGCSCCNSRSKAYPEGTAKSFSKQRPWMISH